MPQLGIKHWRFLLNVNGFFNFQSMVVIVLVYDSEAMVTSCVHTVSITLEMPVDVRVVC